MMLLTAKRQNMKPLLLLFITLGLVVCSCTDPESAPDEQACLVMDRNDCGGTIVLLEGVEHYVCPDSYSAYFTQFEKGDVICDIEYLFYDDTLTAQCVSDWGPNCGSRRGIVVTDTLISE